MIGPLAQIIRTTNSFQNVLSYFCKVRRKSNLCILQFDWLIVLYLFTTLTCNASFLIVKHGCVRYELSDGVFFFRHNFNKSLCKNIFLVSLHSRPSPLVCEPLQLTLFPSPTTFFLCPLISSIYSTEYPFSRKTIFNAFKDRSISLIILAEEGVPIFDSHIPFSPLVTYFGVEKRKPIIISSFLVPSPYLKMVQDAMKQKECKMSLLRLLSKGMNSRLLPTGRPD